eukprot:TRINITY_DN2047_c0_g1_i2.p1 TRINITY_DN2047_c0_g1~~TRINITY_DN2047_c0_g1_i2.p1  ORF type:complete len:271 (+),score=50.29 TRINITY_DN2047_c0_g1_i2:100-912(+)
MTASGPPQFRLHRRTILVVSSLSFLTRLSFGERLGEEEGKQSVQVEKHLHTKSTTDCEPGTNKFVSSGESCNKPVVFSGTPERTIGCTCRTSCSGEFNLITSKVDCDAAKQRVIGGDSLEIDSGDHPSGCFFGMGIDGITEDFHFNTNMGNKPHPNASLICRGKDEDEQQGGVAVAHDAAQKANESAANKEATSAPAPASSALAVAETMSPDRAKTPVTVAPKRSTRALGASLLQMEVPGMAHRYLAPMPPDRWANKAPRVHNVLQHPSV